LRFVKSLDEAALEASLPATLAHGGQLRDYQRQGVTWMLFNWHRSRSSLLADEMGLGKTIQTVIMVDIQENIARRNHELNSFGYFFESFSFSFCLYFCFFFFFSDTNLSLFLSVSL
jgi:hypothetical protein